MHSAFSTSKFSRQFASPVQLLLVAVSVLGLTVAAPIAAAQERLVRTLTVTGKGVEEIPTSLTQVRLGVQAQGKTAEAVQQEVANRTTAVVTLLRSRNVQKLETTGINLSPVYSYTNNQQRITGYQASNTVSFQVETQRSGTLLDDAVKAGASLIEGISFMATDEAIAAAQKVALREATQDAQEQANAVLSALQLTRRDIVGIQINQPKPMMPIPLVREAADTSLAAKVASSPVIGGEQRVEADVTLQISY